MAHERPVSRHGGYDAFKGLQVEDTNYVYQKQDYRSSRPKSGYKKRAELANYYDDYARIPDSQSHDLVYKEGHYNQATTGTPTISSDCISSPQSPTYDSRFPESPEQIDLKSPHPPETYSSRPFSRQQYPGDPYRPRSRATPELSTSRPSSSRSRPSSSLSKYRPLPAIGTPVSWESELSQLPFPKDLLDDHHADDQHLNSQPTHEQTFHHPSSIPHHISKNNINSSYRVPSAISDISVISSKASTTSRRKNDENTAVHLIERLDLSQLNKQSDNGRRRKFNSHTSPSHKQKPGFQAESNYDSGELYDGDDDDSDSNTELPSQHKEIKTDEVPRISSKEPVVIPSENGPPSSEPDQDILLAIKLPTDGTRHQRYFHRFETLVAIVEYAEEQAGQDFAGYILVSNAPKIMFEDLAQTIDEAGLEDKTVLYLEEKD